METEYHCMFGLDNSSQKGFTWDNTYKRSFPRGKMPVENTPTTAFVSQHHGKLMLSSRQLAEPSSDLEHHD